MADRTMEPKLGAMRLGIAYGLMSNRRKTPETPEKLYHGILMDRFHWQPVPITPFLPLKRDWGKALLHGHPTFSTM